MSEPFRSHTDTQPLVYVAGIPDWPQVSACAEFVSWWDGEYEGECELPEGHDGDHYDGLSWYDDDGRCTDDEHRLCARRCASDRQRVAQGRANAAALEADA